MGEGVKKSENFISGNSLTATSHFAMWSLKCTQKEGENYIFISTAIPAAVTELS